MQRESSLDRSLWTIVLAVAAALVIANFAQHPLFGSDGEASGFGQPLTLWVTGGEGQSQTRSLARQVAACWDPNRSVSVGVLPGNSSAAVVDFLQSPHHTPNELLLVSSDTLADVAHDERSASGSETHEHAQLAARLLAATPAVSVLGSDAVTIAVRSASPLRSQAALLSQLRDRPAQPFVGVAEDAWLRGNLAALAQFAGVSGSMPFDAYRSSRLALASLTSGEVGAVLAPRSSLAKELDEGRIRALPWPGSGQAPRAWVALLPPRGLDAGQLTTLRRQTDELCPGGEWQRMLRADGIEPSRDGRANERGLVREGLAEAVRLQALAATIVHEY